MSEKPTRDNQLHVRVDSQTMDTLRALAEALGMSLSATVVLAIREKAKREGVVKQPTRLPSKRKRSAFYTQLVNIPLPSPDIIRELEDVNPESS